MDSNRYTETRDSDASSSGSMHVVFHAWIHASCMTHMGIMDMHGVRTVAIDCGRFTHVFSNQSIKWVGR